MLFWICLPAPILFLVFSLILGQMRPNYSPKRDEMSYLIYGRYGTLQTLNFLLCGLLSIGLAYSLRGINDIAFNDVNLVKAGALAYGVSLILLRVFPTQMKEHKTYVSSIHKVIFILSVLLQATLQIMFALRNVSRLLLTSYLTLSSAVTILGLFFMFAHRDSRGYAQRILVLTIVLWITIGALLIHRSAMGG